MIKKPYIGVTDFTTRQQVEEIKALIPDNSTHRLHVGAMISHKTLNKIPTQTGWENIWLNSEGLQKLFVKDDSVFNIIHYADYGQPALTTSQNLIEAVKLSGDGVSGIQLDMLWPTHALLADLKNAFPDVAIILQVSHQAINSLSKQVTLKDVLSQYKLAGNTDYILLDYGMGRGTSFEPDQAMSLVKLALEVFDEKSVALAGGLGPESYHNLVDIFKKFPFLSCDAQGKMRSSGSAVDPIEIDLVKAYVQGVVSLLAKEKIQLKK